MQNFQDTFETWKQSFISAFSTCMTVPLKINAYKKSFKSFAGKRLKTIQLNRSLKTKL